jgi:hypothetical protein
MLAFDCFLTTDVDMSIKKGTWTSSVWNKALHNLLAVSSTAKILLSVILTTKMYEKVMQH